jgi:cellulose biosynthesis protein BcsQ
VKRPVKTTRTAVAPVTRSWWCSGQNHKGGVTKTTSTANLGAMFAEAGRRVLLVDCDPQANLSEAFGWREDRPGERIEDLLAHPDAIQRYAPPVALQADVAPRLAWRDRLRLIPALAADLDVRGAGKLYDLVEGEIPGLRILGVLIAASDRRWQMTRDAAARMAADRMRVLPVQVPRAVRVASAPRYWAPIAVLEPDSIISHAYRQLAHLLLAGIDR